MSDPAIDPTTGFPYTADQLATQADEAAKIADAEAAGADEAAKAADAEAASKRADADVADKAAADADALALKADADAKAADEAAATPPNTDTPPVDAAQTATPVSPDAPDAAPADAAPADAAPADVGNVSSTGSAVPEGKSPLYSENGQDNTPALAPTPEPSPAATALTDPDDADTASTYEDAHLHGRSDWAAGLDNRTLYANAIGLKGAYISGWEEARDEAKRAADALNNPSDASAAVSSPQVLPSA